MPKTKRDYFKRNLGQAYVNLDYAGKFIGEVYTAFQPVHPDMAEILYYAMEGIYNIQNLMDAFAEKAFGKEIPNWYGWAEKSRPTHED